MEIIESTSKSYEDPILNAHTESNTEAGRGRCLIIMDLFLRGLLERLNKTINITEFT